LYSQFVPAGSSGYLKFPLNKYLTEIEILNAINRFVYRGETSNITDGFSLTRNILTDEAYGISFDIPKTILVITAGFPTDPTSMKTQVNLIKSQKIRILIVGFGPKVSTSNF